MNKISQLYNKKYSPKIENGGEQIYKLTWDKIWSTISLIKFALIKKQISFKGCPNY